MSRKENNCLTRAQGIAIIESFYKSGLKQKEFCARNNIAYHIVQYWKPIHSKHVNSEQKSPKFLPVKIVSPKPTESEQINPIKIVLNSMMAIEVPVGSDIVMLKKVIEVLQACG